MEVYAPIYSSNIETVAYEKVGDPDSGMEAGTMTVTFKDGSTYEYYNVPYAKFLGLQNAKSAGEYFWRNIRNVYAYEQT